MTQKLDCLRAYPTNDWDPTEALLEGDIHVTVNIMGAHKV